MWHRKPSQANTVSHQKINNPLGFSCERIKYMKKNKGGRPTVMTPDVLAKLEDAFTYCYTDEEACLYANISPDALYDYQRKNPQFTERKQLLRKTPNLKAKKVLVENVGSESGARWWAANKMGDEFSPKTRMELNDVSELAEADPADMEAVEEFEKKLRENLIKRRLAKQKI